MEKGNTTNTLLIVILILVLGYVVWEVADNRGRDDTRGTGIEIEFGEDNNGNGGNSGPQ